MLLLLHVHKLQIYKFSNFIFLWYISSVDLIIDPDGTLLTQAVLLFKSVLRMVQE